MITRSGDVFSWGYNEYYILGHNIESNEPIFEPKLIELKNVIKIISNYFNTYFLTIDGFIYFCGKSNSNEFIKIPQKISNDLNFIDIEEWKWDLLGIGVFTGITNKKIFKLKENNFEETKSNSIEEYYCEIQFTAKTVNFKKSKFKSVSEYKTNEMIGKGGFGTVWKVESKLNKGKYAVKIIDIKGIKCL